MVNADPGQDWSDEDLARLATRDPESARGRQAAEMLFGRYTQTVHRWCYRLVPDRERARSDAGRPAERVPQPRALRGLGSLLGLAVRDLPPPMPGCLAWDRAAARALADGSLELRWSAVASADAYRVRILDAALQEVARLEAAGDTLFVVPIATVRGWPTRAACWQVQALSEVDRIADSAPLPLPAR